MMKLTKRQVDIYKVLSPFLLAFPESKLAGEGLSMYARVLDHLSPEIVEAAMQKCMRSAKFFPRLSDIVEAAGDITQEISGESGTPDAGQAWAEAMKLVKERGPYQKWEYSCPEVEAAIKRFGRMELCMLEETAVNTARAQFRDIYNSETKRARGKKEAQEVLNKLGTQKVTQLVASVIKEIDKPAGLMAGR